MDKDTWLTRMHPFTKLCYILTAISVSLISGNLLAIGIFIGISLVILISGKIIRKVFPLIAFSFTILITIFHDLKIKIIKRQLLCIRVKMEPERVRSARRSADWCRSFSKELMAERL